MTAEFESTSGNTWRDNDRGVQSRTFHDSDALETGQVGLAQPLLHNKRCRCARCCHCCDAIDVFDHAAAGSELGSGQTRVTIN